MSHNIFLNLGIKESLVDPISFNREEGRRKGVREMTTVEYRKTQIGKWEAVRPVVIFFGGERFVMEYQSKTDPLAVPVVALVHAYLGSIRLTSSCN